MPKPCAADCRATPFSALARLRLTVLRTLSVLDAATVSSNGHKLRSTDTVWLRVTQVLDRCVWWRSRDQHGGVACWPPPGQLLLCSTIAAQGSKSRGTWLWLRNSWTSRKFPIACQPAHRWCSRFMQHYDTRLRALRRTTQEPSNITLPTSPRGVMTIAMARVCNVGFLSIATA